jgi:hypothetical protein
MKIAYQILIEDEIVSYKRLHKPHRVMIPLPTLPLPPKDKNYSKRMPLVPAPACTHRFISCKILDAAPSYPRVLLTNVAKTLAFLYLHKFQ